MLESLDVWLFHLANSVSGRSFTLDALIALAGVDPVAKAGPVVAAFICAWWIPAAKDERQRRRRVLLVTLAALFVVAPAMKVFSASGYSPRPLVQTETTYGWTREGGIAASPAIYYRVPLTGDAAARHARLAEGTIEPNDLSSFPSDHAALFLALATGIFLAARGPGLLALGWTVLVALGTRVATGMHWPSDMIVGGAIGLAMLAATMALARLLPSSWLDAPLGWSERHPGWSAAILTLLLLEVANAMGLLKRLAELVLTYLGAGA